MGWGRWSRLKSPVKLESPSEVHEERAAADALLQRTGMQSQLASSCTDYDYGILTAAEFNCIQLMSPLRPSTVYTISFVSRAQCRLCDYL